METDKPLVVQSDMTLLLDVHSPSFADARSEIVAFSELIKSPEHMHTYKMTYLSIWNAASAGQESEGVKSSLARWSKFDIPESVIYFIDDAFSRYGAATLDEAEGDMLLLSFKKESYARIALSDKDVKAMACPTINPLQFLLRPLLRGDVKVKLIKLGIPVDDRVPLRKGDHVDIGLKGTFSVRDYQEDSVNSFLGKDLKPGYGNIVLPCGSGKTIVGLVALSRLKTCTLILCPSVASAHQWINELKGKTTLSPSLIGEFTGERKDIRPVTVATYQSLTYRDRDSGDMLNMELFRSQNWGFVIYDEVHMLPAPVFKVTSNLQSLYRLGLTATLIREDGREDEVFSLVGPKRYDTPWTTLERRGFIATAICHEIRIPLPPEEEMEYAISKKSAKHRIAAENPNKIEVVKKLLKKHGGEHILIIGQYIDQLKEIKSELGFPLITGQMSNSRRDKLYDDFRKGLEPTLIVSKVANYSIDLPDASVLIEVSGTFGSRQEEAQRLGRILRPKDRNSHFYALVSKYTSEEDFAMNRQQFLAEQGYSYTLENYDDFGKLD